MNKSFALALLSLGIPAMLLVSCSNKTSDEACSFQTTQDLDHRDYDAVLASSCADDTQRGAAWLGKAGYDITTVINNFSATGSGSSATKDLKNYMTNLIGKVEVASFNNLDNAKQSYTSASNAAALNSGQQKDALFYMSLVDTIKGLSLIKLVVQDMSGVPDTTCNLNGNLTGDAVDATACALKVSNDLTDTCGTLVSTPPVHISNVTIFKPDGVTPYSTTFKALNITTGPATATCSGQYTKLLYPVADPILAPSGFGLATTTQERCTGDTLNPFDPPNFYPCPLDSGMIDFVKSFEDTITSAITNLTASIDIASTKNDVQTSINNIKSENCCTDETAAAGGITPWDPNNPALCKCSPSELSIYFENKM
ncbi:MAG: hypothetical protein A2511_07975 [Deltaproteobacteria bacterium RIFOXYD12_FULL_50_9]|nr:MAG: hypothetical protein A2511_07975 [Deltaproteobacteria bacterium RIFOXYD12_FULL_50_9]